MAHQLLYVVAAFALVVAACTPATQALSIGLVSRTITAECKLPLRGA
jgi:hypothetical protein